MPALENPKHEAFAQNLAKGMRLKDAYESAGFAVIKDTRPALTLKKQPHVKARVQELVADSVAKAEVTIDRVVRELAFIGFSNMQDFVGSDNTPIKIKQLARGHAAAVQSIDISEVTRPDGTVTVYTKLKLYDKRAALVDLGKHLGMFEPDVTNNTLNLIVGAEVETEMLERALLGAIQARVAEDEPPMLVVLDDKTKVA
jgi:phage terminase small subunit